MNELNVTGLTGEIERLRTKKRRLVNDMKVLRGQMANDVLSPEKVDKYVAMNKQLRRVRVIEAEFCYLKNML